MSGEKFSIFTWTHLSVSPLFTVPVSVQLQVSNVLQFLGTFPGAVTPGEEVGDQKIIQVQVGCLFGVF